MTRQHSRWLPVFAAALALVAAACAPQPAAQPAAAPTTAPAPTALPPSPTPVPPILAYALSSKSPQVSVIDTGTNKVVKTADVPGVKAWTWNDDNNYFDGKNLWLGGRDPETNEAEVVLLDLDTLTVTARIPVGKETTTLYIGKPTKDGRLFVAKHASWEMAIIDIQSRKLLSIVPVDVNAGTTGTAPKWANCDVDTAVGPDGVERIFYPTSSGTTTVSLDAKDARQLKVLNHPADSRPCMLTVAPDGTVWVQECAANTNAVLNPATLEVLARFSTGKGPALASFSHDGKLGYITGGDNAMTVVDAQAYRVLRTVEVGATASKAAAHPNGKVVYVALSKENAIAAVDTSSWQVTAKVDIGTTPSGLYVRR